MNYSRVFGEDRTSFLDKAYLDSHPEILASLPASEVYPPSKHFDRSVIDISNKGMDMLIEKGFITWEYEPVNEKYKLKKTHYVSGQLVEEYTVPVTIRGKAYIGFAGEVPEVRTILYGPTITGLQVYWRNLEYMGVSTNVKTYGETLDEYWIEDIVDFKIPQAPTRLNTKQ